MASLRTRRPRLDPDTFIAAAEGAPPDPKPTGQEAPASRPLARAEVRGGGRREAALSPETRERPWEGPSVRADVTKAFNLRLPEPLKLKLDFIRQQTRVSVHEFIMNAVVPAVDQEIERLEKRQR